MPIFEFKCLKCGEYLEILVMNKDEELEMKCSKCGAMELERILSTTSYSMAAGGGAGQSGASKETKTCSSGSCTTYNLPGPA